LGGEATEACEACEFGTLRRVLVRPVASGQRPSTVEDEDEDEEELVLPPLLLLMRLSTWLDSSSQHRKCRGRMAYRKTLRTPYDSSRYSRSTFRCGSIQVAIFGSEVEEAEGAVSVLAILVRTDAVRVAARKY
jgi:hypothetical protein